MTIDTTMTNMVSLLFATVVTTTMVLDYHHTTTTSTTMHVSIVVGVAVCIAVDITIHGKRIAIAASMRTRDQWTARLLGRLRISSAHSQS